MNPAYIERGLQYQLGLWSALLVISYCGIWSRSVDVKNRSICRNRTLFLVQEIDDDPEGWRLNTSFRRQDF